jgi:hypothetical protein
MKNEIIDYGSYQSVIMTTRTARFEVMIDPQDVEQVSNVDRWVVFKDRKGEARIRSGKDSGQVFLHRLLMPDLPPRATVGFKNGDYTDYRRDNLQMIYADGTIVDLVSEAEIQAREKAAEDAYYSELITLGETETTATTHEAPVIDIPTVEVPAVETHPAPPESPPPEKSTVRGVYKHKASRKWHAAAFWDGKRYSLGYFDERQAAEKEVGIFRQHGPDYPTLRRNQDKKA